MVHALVTGTAGFVGSHLAEALVARGDRVRGVDCFTPYYDRAAKEANLASLRATGDFELVEADLRSADLLELLDSVDVVFHQAAQAGVRLSWADAFSEYTEHNVVATQRLLEAAVAGGRVPVVYASSSSVYGNAPRYPSSEEHPTNPHSPYGVTKLAGEHLCRLYAANWGLPTVSLRYFTVYGPRQRPDMAIHRLVEAALSGESFPLYGTGEAQRDFTYVADVVAANLAAAEREVPLGAVVNVAGGGATTMVDLVDLVERAVGREIVLDRRAAVPGDVDRTGGAVDRAANLLGWEPHVDLATGVAAQVAWHRERRGLPPRPAGGRAGLRADRRDGIAGAERAHSVGAGPTH